VVDYLGREYDGAKPVQISFNEPFHRFGQFQWTMSNAYSRRSPTSCLTRVTLRAAA